MHKKSILAGVLFILLSFISSCSVSAPNTSVNNAESALSKSAYVNSSQKNESLQTKHGETKSFINEKEIGAPVELKQNEPINPKSLNLNIPIKAEFLNLLKFNRIVQIEFSDITGDDVEDTIIAVKQSQQPISNNISYGSYDLIIQDGKTNRIFALGKQYMNELEGLGIGLIIGEFNGDKTNDILIHVDTGGNGGAGVHLYRIISFKEDKIRIVFGQTDEDMRVNATGIFLDNFKFDISYTPIGFNHVIDLSSKNEEYSDLYEENKLKNSNITGGIEGFYELVPNDVDNDKVLELIGAQYVCGYGRSDCIGTLRSLIKWDANSNEWKVLKLMFKEGFERDMEWYK